MKGNDIKIFSRRVNSGVASTGKNDVVEIDGAPIRGLANLKIETAYDEFRLVTISFLVRNVEWIMTDDNDS